MSESRAAILIERRQSIMSETAERIRRLLLHHGVDTEAAEDPVSIGFGLGEILSGLVYQTHNIGACDLQRLVQADVGKVTPVSLVANTIRHVGERLGQTESPQWWDSACLKAASELDALESRIDRFAYWAKAEGHDCGQWMSFDNDDTCSLCDLIEGFGELPDSPAPAAEGGAR